MSFARNMSLFAMVSMSVLALIVCILCYATDAPLYLRTTNKLVDQIENDLHIDESSPI